MDKQEVINKIKEGKYELESYFTYPTGTVGNSYIHEQDTFEPKDKELADAIHAAFEKAYKILDIRMDNKTALKLTVEGITAPVYIARYDRLLIVCGALFTNRGGREIEIPKTK